MKEAFSNIRSKLQLIQVPIWLYIFMVLNLLIISLILGSLLSQNWVKSSEWSGGILRINTGKNAGDHYSDQPCSDCIYSDLHKGGIVIIVFDLISLLLMLSWLAILVFKLRDIDLFSPVVQIVLLSGSFVSHWIGIITWGGVTQITFTSSVHYSSTGPALAVSVAVIQPLVLLFYLFLFYNEREHVPQMNSVRFERRHKWSDPQRLDTPPDNKN